MRNVSLILPAFQRSELLKLGLFSISRYKVNFHLEIIVVNDGTEDDTQQVCKEFGNIFDIKYVFSGQRNAQGIKPRCPAWAINIGVKKCLGDVIVLSCPEIWHINDALNHIVSPLLNSEARILTTPRMMYFDDNNYLLPALRADKNRAISEGMLVSGPKGAQAVRMPFLMGMRKKDFVDIGGYDEDFTGYCGDDNDFADRIAGSGVGTVYTSARIVHLYHSGTNVLPYTHAENPAWVYNYNLWQQHRRDKVIIVNKNREWGVL